MNIQEGYLITDLGIIPNNWDVREFEKVLKIIDGDRGDNYPSNDELSENGYCLFLSAKNVTKEGFKFTECIFITKEKDNLLGKGKLLKRDVVLTTRGTVGNIAFFDDSVPFENIRINSGMVILRNENKSLETTYLYIFLKSKIFQNQIDKFVFGSAQPQLTVKGISKFQIAFPSIQEEQKAIAQSLSDVDALITALEQIITKKRDIKQGTMQQLLTGKKRLPNFSGEWEFRKLGDYVDITSGESPSKFHFAESGIPYFKVEQLNNCNKYQQETPYYIKYHKPVQCGSIIFPKRGASILLNKIRILACDSFMDTNLMTLTVKNKLDNEFLFYILSYLELWKIADTTSIPQINNKHINPFSIPCPIPSEQKAIAQILSDMDAEIEALEQKRDKYKTIKQGMMQELLTGKTRLL